MKSKKKFVLMMVVLFVVGVCASRSASAGCIKAWGNNWYGQCNVLAGSDYIGLAAGDYHSLAIKADGSLAGWGRNDFGQCDVPAGDYIGIAAGGWHSLAIKADGSIAAWGDNYYGQCNVPVGSNYIAIAAGGDYSLALKADGSLAAWGRNNKGQCNVPAGDFIAIAAGDWHNLVLKADGSLVSWGDNWGGQCDVPAGSDFVAVAAGCFHSLALKADGSLAAWGHNSRGQCNVPAGSDYIGIAAGWYHSLSLKADGSLAAWGSNSYGQCDVPAGDYIAIAAAGHHSLALVGEPAKPPVADADGPYDINVGDTLTLDANGSTDVDNDIISYMWDIDDDENFETDAGGQAIFDVNYAYLESLGLLINYTYTIHLKVTDSKGQSDSADSTLTIVPKPALGVAVDIKPGSCPNPVNVKSSGVLPVAILGTDYYDVTTIDPTSIRLAGVEPLRSGYEDVAAPLSDANECECTEDGPDGFLDLTLKFKTQRIVEAIGDVNDGDVRVLTLTGVLFDPMPFETPIKGADCILIRGRHKPINPADINKDGVVNAADFAIFAQNWLQSSIVDE